MGKRKSLISFKSISDIIQTEKEFEKIREIAENYNVVEEFDNIFPELKEIAKAKKVDKQTLYLKVENAVWKSELNFQKKVLINKINKFFGKEVIKTIKFL
ncbi:DUF721 domain-containing protein [Rosettibacter firmus]|uniref:DUF721 domain-containing protein n=1 Tax=Rosettibacter firmus TaxID=3111522 RepID=UPI00336C2A1D